MGIKGLMQLLRSDAEKSYKETDKRIYSSRIIAIDASIQLYQFLVQIRSINQSTGFNGVLTDSEGNTSSHLQGFFNRTANLIENGIRPVFVFDGKPPEMKFEELLKRKELKEKAKKEMDEATERVNNAVDEESEEKAIEDLNKASKRNIHITKKEIDEVKYLLEIMGIPIIQAPCEAEAQCAELVKHEKVYAMSTEDMDSLTFGANLVLRKLTMPESSKEKVIEISHAKVLKHLELTNDQFIDLCILCGCDYLDNIRGMGPKTAFKMIKKHGNIETVLENLTDKYIVPEDYILKLETVRNLFKFPDVIPASEIEFIFKKPDSEKIIDFLVTKKSFNRERVEKVIAKITKADPKQSKIDFFFKKKE